MPQQNPQEIERARLRIVEAEQRVLRQRRRVESATVRGTEVVAGRAALDQMEISLQLMKAHLKLVLERFGAKEKAAAPVEDYDLRDLSRRLGVTPEALWDAVAKAGPDPADITARLARKAG